MADNSNSSVGNAVLAIVAIVAIIAVAVYAFQLLGGDGDTDNVIPDVNVEIPGMTDGDGQ